MVNWLRVTMVFAFFFFLLIAITPHIAGANSNVIYVLKVEGPIVPAVADYLHRGLSEAVEKGAQAVIVELDTPGGLVTSAQKIIQDFLASRVPIIVYVSPAGGWAGSAGAFITLSAHVAAMAPSTFIGAAHPVTIGGSTPGVPSSPSPGESSASPSPVEEKMVNALASSIRSIAEQRKRNVDIAEDMVRKSIAKTDNEALELNLIDYRADNLNELLEKLNGHKVNLTGNVEATLNTKNTQLIQLKMSSSERLLQTISDPNIAYILLSLAVLAIFVEISNPGVIFPGVIGGIGLLTALYALGTLQAQWTGIALILLAFGLFIADVFATSHGVFTGGGIVSLALGSLMLFPESEVFRVNPWLIAAVIITVAAFFIFVVTAIVRTQRQPQTSGREGMIGTSAIARTPLEPGGTVFTHGELWQATLDKGKAESGEEVIVTKVDGLKLHVTKKNN